MKQLSFIFSFSLLILVFNKKELNIKIKQKRDFASSILTISNITSATTITSITITYTQPWHSSPTVTIPTNIPPNGTQNFNLGNTSENVFITLNLSNTISGDIQVNQNDPYYCPWLACNVFPTTNTPSVYFYMYGPRWLYLSNYNYCFC